MRRKSGPGKEPAEKVINDIRLVTRRRFSSEEKIRIVLEGLRGDESIAGLCRREGRAENEASEYEIIAILGHKDPRATEVYTRGANRRKLALQAAGKANLSELVFEGS